MFDRAKDALIIVPGFHLATCLVYLFFYHSAFGGGLAYFAEPADIFSVSLADVAPAYVWLGMGLIISHYAFRRDWKKNEFRLDGMSEEERERVAPRAKRILSILHVGIVILLLQSGVTALLFYISTGFISTLFAAIFLQTTIILLAFSALKKLGLTKSQYELLSGGGLVLVALIISGVSDAQLDKHIRYADLPETSIQCDSNIILKKVSNYWLAVGADNSRMLIGEDCKPRFRVISATAYKPLPDGSPADEISKLF